MSSYAAPLEESRWWPQMAEAWSDCVDFHHRDTAVKAICGIFAAFRWARAACFKHCVWAHKSQWDFLKCQLSVEREWIRSIKDHPRRARGRFKGKSDNLLPESHPQPRQSRRFWTAMRWSHRLRLCWPKFLSGIPCRVQHCEWARWAPSASWLPSRTPSVDKATVWEQMERTKRDKESCKYNYHHDFYLKFFVTSSKSATLKLKFCRLDLRWANLDCR